MAITPERPKRRDRKGLYAKAREGIIEDFTGISDPYEEPELYPIQDALLCWPKGEGIGDQSEILKVVRLTK